MTPEEMKFHLRMAHSASNELSALVEEYIGEAEHQDGEGYWSQFSSLEELFADFDLYVENVSN
jgi:hypothetical protein